MPKKKRLLELGYRRQAALLNYIQEGYSVKLAARRVGGSLMAVRRTKRADPAFAIRLHSAISEAEGILLARIRTAAAEEKNWRAATWLLERMHPSRYAARKPKQLTRQQMLDVIDQFAEIVVEEVPAARQRKEILKRLSAVLRDPPAPNQEEASHDAS